MKSDAPKTSTRKLLLNSGQNDIENFFNDLKDFHPCRYWTKQMIIALYHEEYPERDVNNDKQFNVVMRDVMINTVEKIIKIQGKTYRLKTFSWEEAEVPKDVIRKNCDEHWDKTTNILKPEPDISLNVANW